MDRKLTRKILDDFVEAVHKTNTDSGYAYTTGYFASTIVDLLEKLPPHECMAELNHFTRETQRLERDIMVNTLKDPT